MKVLIDTCIIIDALQNRKPFFKQAQQIFLLAADETFEGFITSKSVADIYYLTHQLTHSDERTREILLKLFEIFQIADTLGVDCVRSLYSPIHDYEDAILAETAKRMKADCIVTRNLSDYTKSDLPVFSPKDFLKSFL